MRLCLQLWISALICARLSGQGQMTWDNGLLMMELSSMQDLGQIDGILSFWELSQPLVSRLAERLGLPANPPEAVDAAREKQVCPAPPADCPLSLQGACNMK